MGQYISDGGIFAYLVILIGAAGLVVSALQAAKPDGKLLGLAIGLSVAALLFGVVGTGIGMYAAAAAITKAAPDQSALMFAASWGIALVPTTLASLFGAVSAILCGVAQMRRS